MYLWITPSVAYLGLFQATSSILKDKFGTFSVAAAAHQMGMSLEVLSCFEQLARSGCPLNRGTAMLTSAIWTIDWFSSVPKWGNKTAGFAIMGNTNIWELGAFKAAANAGKLLTPVRGLSHHQAKTVLRCSKDTTGDLWFFHKELSVPLLYSYKLYKGGHRAESFLFAWFRQGQHTGQPWRWWRERADPQKALLSMQWKTQTHLDFSLRQRGFCSLLLTKPASKILCICRAQGGKKGPSGSLQDLSDSCLSWEALIAVETSLTGWPGALWATRLQGHSCHQHGHGQSWLRHPVCACLDTTPAPREGSMLISYRGLAEPLV